MSKIETKERIFDDGLLIKKEVTTVITDEDGTIHTKVAVFDIGSRDKHNDYWRAPFVSDEVIDESIKTKDLLSLCLSEVSQITKTFDSHIVLKYKSKFDSDNILFGKYVYLNKNDVLNNDKLAHKIDYLCGDAIIQAALTKMPDDSKTQYIKSLIAIRDPEVTSIERAANYLYLSIELDAVCSYVKREAPGFIGYINATARKKVSEVGSMVLQYNFFTSNVDPVSKFASIVRELDTFGSQPLDYGPFATVIKSVIEQIRVLNSASSKISAARQIAYRYLKDVENIDDDLISEMSSLSNIEYDKDSLSKQLCSIRGDGKKCLSPNKDSSQGKILNIDVSIIDKLKSSKFKDIQSHAFYSLERDDVKEISSAIEESLLILNNKQPVWDEYCLRSGDIDEGGLYKLTDNSDDIFYKKETLPKTRLQVCILIDESGSMEYPTYDNSGNYIIDKSHSKFAKRDVYLNRIAVARKLAIAFAEGTKNISGVTLNVYGHAGPSPKCSIYKYIDQNSQEDDFYRLAYIDERLHNYDGFAIDAVAKQMLYDESEYTRRIMFILSDGEPSVSEYKGEISREHTKAAVKNANMMGVETYTIGIDNAFSIEIGEDMYGKNSVIIIPGFDLNKTAKFIYSLLEKISKY